MFTPCAVPGGDLPPELDIDFMSESIDNLSRKVHSNDFSSIMPGSIAEGNENGSPTRDGDEMLVGADLDMMSLEFSNRNKRKKRTKLQSKTELDKDTCRKWVSVSQS